MQSKATTVNEYLASLPEDRRAVVSAVRDVILKNLDKAYREGMQYGMIGYCVPHSLFPAGYHCDPKQGLPFAALAAQKNYFSVYLMGLYCGNGEGAGGSGLVRWFHEAWAKTGRKLDMGKACIRFKRTEDLALDVLGQAIRRMPAKKYIEVYEAAMRSTGKGGGVVQRTTGAPKRSSVRKKATKKRLARR